MFSHSSQERRSLSGMDQNQSETDVQGSGSLTRSQQDSGNSTAQTSGGQEEDVKKLEEDDGLFEPEMLLAKRIRCDRGEAVSHVEYLVKWKELPEAQSTWEKAERLEACAKELIDEFESHRLTKDEGEGDGGSCGSTPFERAQAFTPQFRCFSPTNRSFQERGSTQQPSQQGNWSALPQFQQDEICRQSPSMTQYYQTSLVPFLSESGIFRTGFLSNRKTVFAKIAKSNDVMIPNEKKEEEMSLDIDTQISTQSMSANQAKTAATTVAVETQSLSSNKKKKGNTDTVNTEQSNSIPLEEKYRDEQNDVASEQQKPKTKKRSNSNKNEPKKSKKQQLEQEKQQQEQEQLQQQKSPSASKARAEGYSVQTEGSSSKQPGKMPSEFSFTNIIKKAKSKIERLLTNKETPEKTKASSSVSSKASLIERDVVIEAEADDLSKWKLKKKKKKSVDFTPEKKHVSSPAIGLDYLEESRYQRNMQGVEVNTEVIVIEDDSQKQRRGRKSRTPTNLPKVDPKAIILTKKPKSMSVSPRKLQPAYKDRLVILPERAFVSEKIKPRKKLRSSERIRRASDQLVLEDFYETTSQKSSSISKKDIKSLKKSDLKIRRASNAVSPNKDNVSPVSASIVSISGGGGSATKTEQPLPLVAVIELIVKQSQSASTMPLEGQTVDLFKRFLQQPSPQRGRSKQYENEVSDYLGEMRNISKLQKIESDDKSVQYLRIVRVVQSFKKRSRKNLNAAESPYKQSPSFSVEADDGSIRTVSSHKLLEEHPRMLAEFLLEKILEAKS